MFGLLTQYQTLIQEYVAKLIFGPGRGDCVSSGGSQLATISPISSLVKATARSAFAAVGLLVLGLLPQASPIPSGKVFNFSVTSSDMPWLSTICCDCD